MNLRINILIAIFVASVKFTNASPPKTPLAHLKSADSPEGVRSALLALGVPTKTLDSLEAGNSLPGPAELKRAESFKANLDGDAAKETVTQVVFESPIGGSVPDVPLLYFILVHKGKAEGAPAFFKLIESYSCGYAGQGGMKFAFKGRARKDVIISLKVFTGCGISISSYDEVDTLRYEKGAYHFITGPKTNESGMDRSDLPEEP